MHRTGFVMCSARSLASQTIILKSSALMVRSLPWLTENPTRSSHSKPAERPSKRLRTGPEAERHANPLEGRAKRNLSSSPPPPPPDQAYDFLRKSADDDLDEMSTSQSVAPTQECFEPMREGLDADDAWIMVEDEFYATAQQYTQHLHHAEYQRMKREVRALNANNIRIIERPVDPRVKPSTQTMKHAEGQRLRQRQAAGIRGVLSDRRRAAQDDDEDDPWQQNPTLAGLMQNRVSSRPLARIDSSQMRTNVQSSSQVSGAPHSSPPELASSPPEPTKELVQRLLPRTTAAKQKPVQTTDIRSGDADYSPPVSANARSKGNSSHKVRSISPGERSTTTFKTADRSSPRRQERNKAFFSQLAARKKADQERAEKAKKALKVEEVPTFLF